MKLHGFGAFRLCSNLVHGLYFASAQEFPARALMRRNEKRRILGAK
jgi:hypothetical protein